MKDDKELETYIKSKKKISTDDITKLLIVEFIPSMRQLFRVLRKNGHFIDTTSKPTKALIRRAYKLKEDSYTSSERFAYLGLASIHDKVKKLNEIDKRVSKLEEKKVLGLGSLVFCNEKEFGIGEIIQIYNDGDQMRVKFQNRDLATMCSLKKMITIHDNTKRKFKAVA